MPRRDRDPRPSIEVIGGAPTEESVQAVDVGADGRGPRWWRLGLAALVVGIGLVALLGDGQGGGDERSASSSTTRSTVRRTTTSSTTTTLPPPSGPVLPVQTGASLLLAAQSGDWLLLDLDTGGYRMIDDQAYDVFGGLVPVTGGIVVADGTTTTYLPILTGAAPVDLGDGGDGFLLASGRGDRVWIGGPSIDGPIDEIRLVDLRGRTLAHRPFSPYGYAEATVEGPVFGDGGRTYVVGADGPRVIGIGQPVGSSADEVVVRECGDDGTCVPIVVDLLSGDRRELSALRSPVGEIGYGTIELTPDGDAVALDYAPDGRPHLRWLDGDGRLLAEGDIEVDPNLGFGFGNDPTFLPSRQGIVLPTGTSELSWVRPVDGQLQVERRALPGSHRVERVVLLSP